MSLARDHTWIIEKDSKEEKVYKNLERQIDKVFRHTRQCSIKTRERYKDGVKHFAKFLAVAYKKQNMNNISNKHLESYVEQAQEAGYSTSYITTNISAIKFFIDQIKDSSYVKSNEELGVIVRSSEERIGPNRAWTKNEIENMQNLAVNKGFEKVAYIMKIAHLQGLRLHEITRLNRVDLQKAIYSGQLTVKGKGGLERSVSIKQETREIFQRLISNSNPREQKIFVNSNEKTHQVIKQVQNFITNNRNLIQEERIGSINITFHGLRHTFAQERYKELRNQGLNDFKARLEVSKELGHFRVDITNVYLK